MFLKKRFRSRAVGRHGDDGIFRLQPINKVTELGPKRWFTTGERHHQSAVIKVLDRFLDKILGLLKVEILEASAPVYLGAVRATVVALIVKQPTKMDELGLPFRKSNCIKVWSFSCELLHLRN